MYKYIYILPGRLSFSLFLGGGGHWPPTPQITDFGRGGACPTYMNIYIQTREDPCIKCTRSKLDTGQGVLGLVAPEDLLSACCLVLPLLLSALVSSCPFPSGLVPVGLQGLSWASPGPLLGPSWTLLGLSQGPLEPFWVLLGGSWAVLNGLGWRLAGSWSV